MAALAEAFNSAFSDYLVPVRLSENDLRSKLLSENTNPELSAGAFLDGRLVGFILIGIDKVGDKVVAYNGGTGVIPECRGQNLTGKMYRFLFPLLEKKGIVTHQLEVITENVKAIPVYEKIGFQVKRVVSCFRGKVIAPRGIAPVEIKSIDFPDQSQVRLFCDFNPTYQNMWSCILRTKEMHRFLGAFEGEKLIGYLIFAEDVAKVKQFGVAAAFRKKGVGRQLFYELQCIAGNKIVSLNNVDHAHDATIGFLKEIGLEMTVQQYEMTYRYDD